MEDKWMRKVKGMFVKDCCLYKVPSSWRIWNNTATHTLKYSIYISLSCISISVLVMIILQKKVSDLLFKNVYDKNWKKKSYRGSGKLEERGTPQSKELWWVHSVLDTVLLLLVGPAHVDDLRRWWKEMWHLSQKNHKEKSRVRYC